VAFTYLKVKSAKSHSLFPVVLVLVWSIWFCLHHWRLLLSLMVKEFWRSVKIFGEVMGKIGCPVFLTHWIILRHCR